MEKMYWIVLYNDDQGSFNVLGPVNSDAKTTNFTAELQRYGINVRMQAIDMDKKAKSDLIREMETTLKLNEQLNWVKD